LTLTTSGAAAGGTRAECCGVSESFDRHLLVRRDLSSIGWEGQERERDRDENVKRVMRAT
jgi:hypothetical protein